MKSDSNNEALVDSRPILLYKSWISPISNWNDIRYQLSTMGRNETHSFYEWFGVWEMFDGDELTRIHIRITSKTRRLGKVVNEKTTKNIVWSDSLSSKTHRTIAIAASLKNFEIQFGNDIRRFHSAAYSNIICALYHDILKSILSNGMWWVNIRNRRHANSYTPVLSLVSIRNIFFCIF